MSFKTLLGMYVVRPKYLLSSKIFNFLTVSKYIMLVVRELNSNIEILYHIVLLYYLHCGIPKLLYMILSHNKLRFILFKPNHSRPTTLPLHKVQFHMDLIVLRVSIIKVIVVSILKNSTKYYGVNDGFYQITSFTGVLKQRVQMK